jgi:hypothetical protein
MRSIRPDCACGASWAGAELRLPHRCSPATVSSLSSCSGTLAPAAREQSQQQPPVIEFEDPVEKWKREANELAAERARERAELYAREQPDWAAWDRWVCAHVERGSIEYRRKIQRPLLAGVIADVQHEYRGEIKTLKAQIAALERSVAGQDQIACELRAQIAQLQPRAEKRGRRR